MRLAGLCLLLLQAAWGASRPSPDLTPGRVVQAVVEALRHNNSPLPNAGVFTAYQFASPANHAAVGPYGRFLAIVKSVNSAPLLSGQAAEFSPIEIRDGRAQQTVRIPVRGGQPAAFRFTLSRQKGGACLGCWMVDGVVRLP
jgi:uncharacterized protein DUF4864